MKEIVLISLTPDELRDIIKQAVAVAQLSITMPRKHVYTMAEVGEQIGYSRNSISKFIREGKRARNGKIVRLKAREITAGDFRITPEDLDDFIRCF